MDQIAVSQLNGADTAWVLASRHPGRVRIKGESWRAATEAKDTIPVGTQVIVRKTYGTTLWVEPVA